MYLCSPPLYNSPTIQESCCCTQACHRLSCPFPNLWSWSRRKVAESVCVCAEDLLEDQAEFLIIPRHQELLGDRARDCDISVSVEKTGLEGRGQCTLSYVLFRCVWEPFICVFLACFPLEAIFPCGEVLEPIPGAYVRTFACYRTPFRFCEEAWEPWTKNPPLPSPAQSTTTSLFLACDILNSCIFILQETDSRFLPRMQRGWDSAPLPATAPALHQSVLQYQMQK